MVHIVLTSWWPLPLNDKISEKWAQLSPQIQPLLKSMKIYFMGVKAGVQATGYNEVEDGKMEEAYNALFSAANELSTIEGYTYQLSIQLSWEEVQAAQNQT